jgi:hypothetical protein
VFDRGELDLCIKDPGYAVDLSVTAHIRDLVDVWLGTVELRRSVQSGSLRLEGPRTAVRDFKKWFTVSMFTKLVRAHEAALEPSAGHP